MANHGVAAFLIASLLVAVILSDSVTGGYAALTCNSVRAVQQDETCFSVAQGGGLTLAQFLGFNPNINCVKMFVGQWVCLDATSA